MSLASRTLAAVERVKAKHPFAASGAIARSEAADTRAASLWGRLSSLSGDALKCYASTLTGREVRLACYGALPLIGDEGVIERLAVVLDGRNDSYYQRSPVAWIAYLVSSGDARLRACARVYLGTRPEMSLWHCLADHPAPLAQLKCDYMDGRVPFASWWASKGVALEGYQVLERTFLRRLLMEETADVLVAREGTAAVDRWLGVALDESKRVAWHVRYLIESDATRWRPSNTFLERILERFRTPPDGHSFWDGVPPERQAAFVRWLRDRELTSLLGEGERVEFWRRFLGEIERSLESIDGAAVFIVFDTWFAVQFKETGKATYMLPRNRLIAVRRLAEVQLYRYVLDKDSLGRYTHQGGYWQYNAQREVRRVLQEQAAGG